MENTITEGNSNQMRNPQYEVTEYPLNLILDHYTDPWSLIHPLWLRDYLEEQKILYGERPTAREAFKEWNLIESISIQ